MKREFFKFPHTPHLAQLGNLDLRKDKLLNLEQCEGFLSEEVIVEEKVDGANIGISLDETGNLQVQNRGGYLRQGAHPQFEPLWPWLYSRADQLTLLLKGEIILFGEWCFAVHSVKYTGLSDWFLGFDCYDLKKKKFFSVGKRNDFLKNLEMSAVSEVDRGIFSLQDLITLLKKTPSNQGGNSLEGFYLRKEKKGFLELRAKIVQEEFLQTIDEHWSKGSIEKNSLTKNN